MCAAAVRTERLAWGGCCLDGDVTPRVLFLPLSGLVAFRQHLQNLARTKGILELNKVQMLVEQMGSSEGAAMTPVGQQHHLHNLLEVSIHTALHSAPVKLFS